MIDKPSKPMTEVELELDAVRLWVLRIPVGRRTVYDLIQAYDVWSDEVGAPMLDATMRLSMRLRQLGYEPWRTANKRGFVIKAKDSPLQMVGTRSGAAVCTFTDRVVPGRYTDERLYRTYVPWAQAMGEPILTLPWFCELATCIGRRESGLITTGRYIVPSAPDAGAHA